MYVQQRSDQMGGKPSHAMSSNRPEAGGADKDMIQEKSGILDREKNEFAASQKEKEESVPEHPKGIDDKPEKDNIGA
jgi:hypothetical protein